MSNTIYFPSNIPLPISCPLSYVIIEYIICDNSLSSISDAHVNSDMSLTMRTQKGCSLVRTHLQTASECHFILLRGGAWRRHPLNYLQNSGNLVLYRYLDNQNSFEFMNYMPIFLSRSRLFIELLILCPLCYSSLFSLVVISVIWMV